jgi:hypothetical protein
VIRRSVAVATACVGTFAAVTLSTTYAAAAVDSPAVELGGSPLPGGGPSIDPEEPTVLPAGVWHDALGEVESPQATHYFRYQRTMADSTVHVGVIGASLDWENTDGVDIAVTVGDNDCGSDSASSGSLYHGTFGAGVVVGPDEPGSRDSACLTADTLEIAVTRDPYASAESARLPVAVRIVEEAPVADVADLPAPEPEPTTAPVESGADAEDLPGSDALVEAPELDAGGDGAVLETEVAQGEEQLYQVPLDWGQRLEVTARVAAQDEQSPAALAVVQPSVDLSFVAPERDTYQDLTGDAEPSGTYAAEPLEIWDATPRVAYLNRFDGTEAAVPGTYWIALAVTPAPASQEIDPVAVPVELTVRVDGERAGAPSYPQSVTAPGGAAGPDGYDAERPFLVGEDTFARTLTATPDGDGFWSPRRWAGLGLGVVSLALLGAGGWQVLARRRA